MVTKLGLSHSWQWATAYSFLNRKSAHISDIGDIYDSKQVNGSSFVTKILSGTRRKSKNGLWMMVRDMT